MTPNANSTMLVRPTMTAPAARSRATAAASRCAGGASARIFEPARVTSPADVEQVFHRDRQTLDRRSHDARASQPVGVIRLGARHVRVDLRERARPFAGWVSDARERALDEFAARYTSVARSSASEVYSSIAASTRVAQAARNASHRHLQRARGRIVGRVAIARQQFRLQQMQADRGRCCEPTTMRATPGRSAAVASRRAVSAMQRRAHRRVRRGVLPTFCCSVVVRRRA